jgi:toxin ParE1/3/4
MTVVEVSNAAKADLSDITDHYMQEAGIEVALAFTAAWDRCTRHIADFPDSGSLRLAEKIRMLNLRVWPIKGFPHLVLYRVGKEAVHIERVLHSARDIPATLRR